MDTLETKRWIAAELNKGVSLGDIQKQLTAEFNIKMTFLELRLLAAELENIDWAKQDPVKPEKKPEDAAQAAAVPQSGTVVEISKIARPGAMANGTVKFQSGASAEWIVDSSGRLGFDKVDGEPTKEDMQEFMKELQQMLGAGR